MIADRPIPVSGAASRVAPRRLPTIALICAAILFVGIGFRTLHIDRKIFWDDEIYTAIHVVGLTEAEIVANASAYRTAGDLDAVIHPARSMLRPVGATIASIATEDASHTPLYYVLAHYWVGVFGTSIVALRSLSVAFGLATLPCMFWLCRELFGSTLSGWVGAALVAISPIGVLYGQEAREYSLWTLLTLITCALFLRALRRPTVVRWLAYAVALTLSFYCYPFAVLVAIGNAIFALFRRRDSPRALPATLVSTVAAVLAFGPWIVNAVGHAAQIRHGMTQLLTTHLSALAVVRHVLRLAALSLLDLGQPARAGHLIAIGNALAALAVITLVALATAQAVRVRDGRTWPYIALLILMPLLPFVASDLISPGDRTGQPRYVTPMYIGLDLTLVYLFTVVTQRMAAARRWVIVATVVIAAVVTSRAISCAAAARADTWWTTYDLQAIPIAATIDRSDRPMVVSDNYIVWAMVLSTYLKPTVPLALRPTCYMCANDNARDSSTFAMPATVGEIFLLGPSRELIRSFSREPHPGAARVTCIDVRDNCASALSFFAQ